MSLCGLTWSVEDEEEHCPVSVAEVGVGTFGLLDMVAKFVRFMTECDRGFLSPLMLHVIFVQVDYMASLSRISFSL